MRKLLVVLLACLPMFASSQTIFGSMTLANNSNVNYVTSYFAMDGTLSNFTQSFNNGYGTYGSVGCTIGITTNGVFTFGFTGSYIFMPNDPNLSLSKPLDYQTYNIHKYAGYGGLLLEPTIFHRFPIHLTIPLIGGIGGARYVLCNEWEAWTWDANWFWYLSAGVHAELNVAQGFRISVGPSYHWIPNLNMVSTSPELMNGFALDLTFKFGEY